MNGLFFYGLRHCGAVRHFERWLARYANGG